MKSLRWIPARLACLACLLLLLPPPLAADVPVTAGAVDDVDDGDCSLIEAFQSVLDGVAQDACGDTTNPVVLPAGSEFVLDAVAEGFAGDNGLPVVDGTLVVEGNGATVRRDAAAPRFRLIYVGSDGDLTVRDLTLADGWTVDSFGSNGAGGGIANGDGTVTLERVVLDGNRAQGSGGAVSNAGGIVRLIESVVTNNEAQSAGKALWSNSELFLDRTEVSRNGFGRHAIVAAAGTLEVIESSVVFNDSGGIRVESSVTALVRNSTLSFNGPEEGSPELPGGGILVEGDVRLEYVTIAGNDGATGDGFFVSPTLGTLTLLNSVVASNATYDCEGPVVSLGGNLVEDVRRCTGIVDGVNGDITDIDPLLGVLQGNGGPTRTQLPAADSPLLDAAVGPGCIDTDQRGVSRPQGGACDVGAVEVVTAEEPPPPPPGSGPGPTEIPTAGQWGLMILCLLLGLIGFGVLGRDRGSFPAGLGVVLLLLTVACGGAPEATADEDPQDAPSSEGRASSAVDPDSPNRFTLSGSREVTVRDPWVSIMEAAGEGLYDDDHPGRILWIRERDKDLRHSVRVEIVLMPGQFGPGTYPLHETVWADYSRATAGVVLPKVEEESTVLPMAIYAEDVDGEITLEETADGTVSGSFRFWVALDSGQPEPHLEVEGEFAGARWPSADG